MESNTQTVELFCRQNQSAYRHYLNRFAANRILLSPVIFCVVIPVLITSVLNSLKYGLTVGLAYVPAVVAIAVFKILFELNVPVKTIALQWTDTVLLGIFFGFNFVLGRVVFDGKLEQLSSNGSMLMILMTV